MAIDGTARTGTLAMDGAVYPIADALPAGARRLAPAADEGAVVPAARRKLNAFGGALMTSGSFTMMAASAGSDRRRKLFNGALMDSGTFTMMAAGGGV